MFKEERERQLFQWTMIGDIGQGRPNLGASTDVSVYRLMQFTLRDVLVQELGAEAAERMFFLAGERAGREFCKTMVEKTDDFGEFFKNVQVALVDLKVGILRIEQSDLENMNLILTLAEDLDCSGLPVSHETVCTYDEGFLKGLLTEQTGREFTVREVDCWCSGDRVCRFEVKSAPQG